MEIIGKMPVEFFPKNATNQIKGIALFLAEAIDTRRGGVGVKAEKVFLSENNLGKLDFTPTVGMEVSVGYNRWGKVETLYLISDPDDLEVE